MCPWGSGLGVRGERDWICALDAMSGLNRPVYGIDSANPVRLRHPKPHPHRTGRHAQPGAGRRRPTRTGRRAAKSGRPDRSPSAHPRTGSIWGAELSSLLDTARPAAGRHPLQPERGREPGPATPRACKDHYQRWSQAGREHRTRDEGTWPRPGAKSCQVSVRRPRRGRPCGRQAGRSPSAQPCRRPLASARGQSRTSAFSPRTWCAGQAPHPSRYPAKPCRLSPHVPATD
jgi:hypothetical protein